MAIDCPDDVVMHAGPDHLRRALVNLMSNSAKYGRPPLSLVATTGDEYVEVRLTDDGDGVPEELRPRLFEPFARAEAVRTVAGDGLGPSIVKGLVEAIGGEVRLRTGHATPRLLRCASNAPDDRRGSPGGGGQPDIRTLVRITFAADPDFVLDGEAADAATASGWPGRRRPTSCVGPPARRRPHRPGGGAAAE